MFRDSLQKIVESTPGGLAGILMGFDGIAVETYARPGAGGPDIQTVGMELSHLISQLKKAAGMLEVGGLQEITLKMEGLRLILYLISEEYFLACALRPEGNFGKARYLVRLHAPQIRAEL